MTSSYSTSDRLKSVCKHTQVASVLPGVQKVIRHVGHTSCDTGRTTMQCSQSRPNDTSKLINCQSPEQMTKPCMFTPVTFGSMLVSSDGSSLPNWSTAKRMQPRYISILAFRSVHAEPGCSWSTASCMQRRFSGLSGSSRWSKPECCPSAVTDNATWVCLQGCIASCR